MVPFVRIEDETALLDVDETIYSEGAVLRAVYEYSDRCFIALQRVETRIHVAIKAKSGNRDLETLAMGFLNSLADHELRVQIDRETRDIRTLLVAQAFAEGDLLSEVQPPPPEE
jgi:His-Xaa-Ser system protein HxsD